MRPPETVRSEEIRALFEQGGPVLWANVGVGAVVVGTLWATGPHERLLAWLVALLLLTTLRSVFQREYAREKPSDSEMESWGRRFVLGSTISGVLWGAAGALFFESGSLLSQAMLLLALGGMTAAAASTLVCYMPAFTGYFLCSFVPITVRAFAEGDRVHLGMGALLLVYGIGLQRVARNNAAAFGRAFRLGLENTDLLQRLSLSKVELQETNRTLEHRVVERTKALEQQSEALRQAQRLEVAGRLAGGLAHDFNSLLTVIINNSVLMKESQGLDEQGRSAADETLEAAERGAALIRQLLAFSRRKRPEPRIFSLNQLLEEWAALFERILGQGVTTRLELAGGETHVRADPAQVEQVLVNLVANARAAMPKGGQLLIATEVCRVDGDAELAAGNYVQLIVQHFGSVGDDGDGASAFDPYTSFDGDSRSRSLGFAAAWGLAPQWGGRVVVDAEPGAGARFRVYLPMANEEASPLSEQRLAPGGVKQGATVLVVDDEPTLRAVLRRSLLRAGYQVLVAEDGARALALAKSTPSIDLLITDVVMPGISGLELAQQVLLERPQLRVLFISGFTFEETVPATDLANGTAYLPKPFDTKVLIERVRQLLAVSSQASELAIKKASG